MIPRLRLSEGLHAGVHGVYDVHDTERSRPMVECMLGQCMVACMCSITYKSSPPIQQDYHMDGIDYGKVF